MFFGFAEINLENNNLFFLHSYAKIQKDYHIVTPAIMAGVTI